MNISYVASRIAELNGVKVIDNSKSIRICADKINMYLHMMENDVSIPKTRFLRKSENNLENLKCIVEEIGLPLIVKEPSTSFSMRVEKVNSIEEFSKIVSRFLRLSDILVAQEFIETRFDWRVGILNGEVIYVCKYLIPKESFKIQD